MIGVHVHNCCACNGAGGLKPDNRPCKACDGDGRMVVCLGCGADFPEPEAETEGGYCATCRAALDIAEVA